MVKVFISVDIEGVTGIVSFSQCGRPDGQHYDYAFARRMLVHDVNAAIRGARAGGATHVVVKDAHATCKNLLIDDLEPGTELISGYGYGPDGMMHGIDESFDAAMLVGYHAMAGAQQGMMEHALAGGVHRFWINGGLAGEIAVSAAVASGYGVPTVLVTSDETGCIEAQSALPGVKTYSTKRGMSKYMGLLVHPSETGPGIEAAAAESIASLSSVQLYRPSEPTTLRVEFHKAEETDLPSMLEGVTRVDGYTLELTRPTFRQAHSAMVNVFQMSIQGRRSGD